MEDGMLTAGNPQMVKINDDKLLVLWQLKADSAILKDTVYYTFLDKTGTQTDEIKQFSGNLSDCQPIVCGDKVVWYTWDGDTVIFNSFLYDNPPEDTAFEVNIELPEPETNVSTGSVYAKTTVNGNETNLSLSEDGKLDVSDLPDGNYTFTFGADNCAPRLYDVTVKNGEVVSGLENGVQLKLWGDITGDGKIDISDVTGVNNYANSIGQLNDYDVIVAHVSTSAKIDIRDVTMINNHANNVSSLWK